MEEREKEKLGAPDSEGRPKPSFLVCWQKRTSGRHTHSLTHTPVWQEDRVAHASFSLPAPLAAHGVCAPRCKTKTQPRAFFFFSFQSNDRRRAAEKGGRAAGRRAVQEEETGR
jgi:hypothetical protein